MAEAPPPYTPPPPQTNPYHAGYDQAQPKYAQPPYPAPPPAQQPYPAAPASGPYAPMGAYPATQQPTVSTQVNVTQVSAAPVCFGFVRRDYTCSAIWVCLCCFWPTGIAAIYYANRAQDEYAIGNHAEAEVYQRRARMFIILSIVLGIVLAVIGGVIIGVVKANSGYRDDPYSY